MQLFTRTFCLIYDDTVCPSNISLHCLPIPSVLISLKILSLTNIQENSALTNLSICQMRYQSAPLCFKPHFRHQIDNTPRIHFFHDILLLLMNNTGHPKVQFSYVYLMLVQIQLGDELNFAKLAFMYCFLCQTQQFLYGLPEWDTRQTQNRHFFIP